MADKKQKNQAKKSYIFTRETMGMTLVLFCLIVLIVLLTRNLVLDNFGAAICTFMYGSFGYGSIPVVLLLAYFGVWLVSERSIKVKPSIALSVTACVVVFFLLFHAVTTRNISIDSFGEYLSGCYNSAASGWSGYTFGGAVCGLVVYPVAKFTTFIGAYVIFSVLLILCGYLVFFTVFRGKIVRAAKGKVIKVTEVQQDDSQVSEPASIYVRDNIYTENDTREIAVSEAAPVYDAQPAPQPVVEEQPQPVEEDKYSRNNLGRKILFENGEFAAESYRRNMIFSEDSYFNHPVTSESDYLSSFSSNSQPKQQQTPAQSYTQSYQKEVLNQPVVETPSNYVYGEAPVQNLTDDYSYNEKLYEAPAEPSPTYEEAADSYAESIRDSQPYIEPPVQQPQPPVQSVQPEQPNDSDIYGERIRFARPVSEPEVRAEQPEQPAPIPTEEPALEQPKESSSNILASLFGGESMRGERGRAEERGTQREERNKENLFDDDEVDLGEDLLGVSSRDSGAARGDRTERTERTERIERTEPPAAPASTERTVGFSMPSSERRAAPESPKAPEPEPAPKEEKPKHVWKKYVHPSLDLLVDYPENNNINAGEIEENKRIIVEILENFKIASEVTNVTIAPAITRYDVTIFDKTKTKTALNYRDDIALALMKKNVNTYLNYTKGAISIEVPNSKQATVGLKSLLASSQFINCKPNSLTFGLGKNVDGEVVCPDITKMPHLLVAGTTGSGKSICLNALLISLLYKYGPEELRLILVDPKQAEFIPYDNIPHLMINEILYDVDKVIKALNWAVKEMERRYALFKEMTEKGVTTKTLDEYNAHLPEGEEKLPKIVIILDEFADLMVQAKKDIEGRIVRLAQKSRACGIHLILATQRPSVDCITGLIKSNLPSRIGFKVNSYIDSGTIFDVGGAEKLLGRGDMYFRSVENPDMTRIQGCFIDSPEIQKVTDFVREHNETYFDQEASDFINKVEEPEVPAGGGDGGEDGGDTKIDDTFIKALKFCVTSNQASVSMIQRRFPVGYIKACKIIDWMENMNYVTPSEGSKPRKVIMTKEEFINTYGDVDD